MKSKVIFVFICVVLAAIFWCRSCHESTDSILSKNIKNFEAVKHRFLNFSCSRFRKGRNSSISVSRFDSTGDYAVIRLYPNLEIEKNFVHDTIDMLFLKEYKSLNCESLRQNKSYTTIIYGIQNKRIVVFKLSADTTYTLKLDTTGSKEIMGWRYVEFDKR